MHRDLPTWLYDGDAVRSVTGRASMKHVRTIAVVSSLIILVECIIIGCIIGLALIFLLRAPESYTWVMDRGTLLDETHLVKMCSNGTEILNVQFGQSEAIGVDPRSGSIWAPELNDRDRVNIDQVVNIDADGTIIGRYPGFRTSKIAVDPNDGSVWVGLPNEAQVVKLNSNGEILLRVAGYSSPASIAVDPRDSSIWVANSHPNHLVHLDADGSELSRLDTPGFFSNAPHQVAVDPHNGNVWYTGSIGNVYKISSSGQRLVAVEGFDRPVSVSVDPSDGGVWVADFSVESSGSLVRLDSDGNLIWSVILVNPPLIAAVNPFDGTVWAGVEGALFKLSAEGGILDMMAGFTSPQSIAFVRSAKDVSTKIDYFRTCHGFP